MMITMKPNATAQEIEEIMAHIKALGLRAHLWQDGERTIVGVLGSEHPLAPEHFEEYPGVERAVRMLRRGEVMIEIAQSDPGTIQVTVARSCDDPVLLKLVEEILQGLVRRQPGVIVKRVEPAAPPSALSRKRGGPAGLPESQRLEIVQGWYKVQGRMKETSYARSQNISPSTLRRWIREFRRDGKL